ncbi:MAG: acyl-ACP--UDP-N-acetylglucosamine O-acyltransferase [candidate division Zixibacteria bacterium]|nr:acyl-ACP--UDP-N-acetylglucosamine O-acyltransferase [candidate division Zixibacteria bacterium]
MSNIHPTAIISHNAKLAEDVIVGPYSIIEDNVQIGEGTKIASTALIADGARIGKNVTIAHGAVISTVPQDLKFSGEETTAIIGDGTTIREYATVNRGTSDKYRTKIGKNCLIMAYAHVAHDCSLGDDVIMGNACTLAGHIEIGDCAILSGILPVHQFVKIGAHSYIGGGYRVPQDVCPYALAAGYPLKISGLNIVGLKRRGFSKSVLKSLRETYKLLFFSGLNTTQAVTRIKDDIEIIPEVQLILDFIENSERGLMK